MNECNRSNESDPEALINLKELINHRKGKTLEDVINKNFSQNQSLTKIESKKQHKNKLSKLESDESPKQCKLGQKRQRTEEKERKKLQRRTCTICKTIFAYPGALKNHIRSKHTFEKPFTCEICGEQFSIQSSFSLHRRRHLDIKPHLCHLCGKTCLRKVDLQIHMQIHIPSKDKIRNIKCDYCSNMYTSKVNLLKHILNKHTDPGEWKHECNICKKRCASASDLNHHIQKHNDDRNFKCIICERGFFTKQNLNVHARTHSIDTPFNCKNCSNGYRSNEALKRHMLKIHEIGEEKPMSFPTHFCFICNEGFRQRARLHQHLFLHESVGDEYPYRCNKCGRKYKARNYFIIHMKEKHNVIIDDTYFKTLFTIVSV